MEYLVIAITVGGLYALMALGYALIYGCLRLINFAHGEFGTTGAYCALWSASRFGFDGPLLFVTSAIAGAAIAVLTWVIAYRPLRHSNRSMAILTAVGASICLQQGLSHMFGSESRAFPYLANTRSVAIMGFKVDSLGIVTVLTVGGLLVLVHWLWKYSTIGRKVRAVADDRDNAEACGINANGVTILVFAFAGAVSGIAGVILASSFGRLEPTIGFAPALKAFVAALAGGLTDPRRAALGGLALGVLETLAVAVGLSAYRDALVLSLLVFVLVVRAGATGRLAFAELGSEEQR